MTSLTDYSVKHKSSMTGDCCVDGEHLMCKGFQSEISVSKFLWCSVLWTSETPLKLRSKRRGRDFPTMRVY